MSQSRRRLPSVHSVVERPELAPFVARYGREAVVQGVRACLQDLRAGHPGSIDHPGDRAIVDRVRARLEQQAGRLKHVINGTGVLLHTGLGRAPFGLHLQEALSAVGEGYCNVEFDLQTGERGSRTRSFSESFCELTGAEAATVANNNAAATFLALRALASGREVIVSRGQLIEIGGSYRLPDIFKSAGASLIEVGTTNRTRLADYEAAIGPNTALILRVHTSNYQIVGFTESVGISALARLARERGIVCVDDIGSGALAPGLPPGLPDEPSFAASLAAGAHLVLASGDKLLGGPQSGIIAGEAALVTRLQRDPLMRVLRVDKLTLAALLAAVSVARSPALAVERIPLWKLISTPLASLRSRAEKLSRALAELEGFESEVVESQARMGGGSSPEHGIPSVALRVRGSSAGPFAREAVLAAALRNATPPLITRVHGQAVWIDMKTVFEHEDASIRSVFQALTAADGPTESAIPAEG